MPGASPADRLEHLAPWVAGALIALPVLVAHYPPMADVPLHEAVVGLLRHWGDPKYVPANVYQLNLGLPNQLFYFAILALSYVVPIGTATKLVVASTLFAMPIATGRLADHLGVTRWAAVVIAPLGLGWMFFWGLLANLSGLDLFLFALPFLDRFCERPTLRALAAVCGFVVVIHFAHELMALITAGTLVVFTACSWRGWRENVLRLLPTGVVLALALRARATAEGMLNKHHAALAGVEWYPLAHKIVTAPGALYAGYEWWVRDLIFLVCAVPVVLFGVERWQHRARKTRTWREALHHLRFELLGASLVFLYCVAPVNMKGTTLVYHRFLTPAWILLTLTACTRARLAHPWRLPRMLAAFVPLAPLLTSWPRFADSDRIYTDLDVAIAQMEPASTYALIELGPTDRYWLYRPVSAGGHIVAVLGGRSLYDFSMSESAPVYQRLDKQWSTIIERTNRPYELLPSYDLTHFRYVILHSPDDNVADVAVMALAPEARPVVRQGEWTVMESTLPLVPIDSPDEPTPASAGKSLHVRCLEVVARLRSERDAARPP